MHTSKSKGRKQKIYFNLLKQNVLFYVDELHGSILDTKFSLKWPVALFWQADVQYSTNTHAIAKKMTITGGHVTFSTVN